MCGIAGAIAPSSGIDPSVLIRMNDRISHRGPDGEGYLLGSSGKGRLRRSSRDEVENSAEALSAVGFAHRRLTIIDLTERSDQPLVDASGKFAISYNGEVYNYLELREELIRLGHSFRSEGDTEVVLEAYKEWGGRCVERFVGMWAFAILDNSRRSVLLSRDRFGIKPLYYARVGDALYFASEIKALLGVPGLEVQPNEELVRRFLLDGGVDYSEETFFRGITKLPPAHNLSIGFDTDGTDGEPEPRRFWSYPPQDGRVSEREAATQFRELLEDAIRIHARSDVPVGTCLSGGLDSSSIVCVAEELRAEGQIPRYTHSAFGYLPQDETFSERRYMESVIDKTGARIFVVDPPVERFVDELLGIVRQQDEPFGSTSIAAQWFVFEAAGREGMKVMLDGQGADEVLGGYHGYFPVIASNLLRQRRLLSYARFSREHKELLGERPLPPLQALWSVLPDRARRTVSRTGRVPLPPGAQLMSAEMRQTVRRDYEPDPPSDLYELLRTQTESMSLPSLLRFEDRNSMAHSIEARVPYLDHRVVEFAFRLSTDMKIRGVETKRILREAMRGVLPEDIRARKDKLGFRAEPQAAWIIAERHRDSLVANRTEYERRWFDPEGMATLLDVSDRSTENEWLAWRAINVKLWLRQHWGGSGDLLN
jgi:asparagine synthase (glutamine-hydrolysing)